MVAPEKKDLNKAALDAELAKAVAKNLITKSMPKAKRNQILGRQDLVEKEAIKQLKEKINQLKEDKKNLQKVLRAHISFPKSFMQRSMMIRNSGLETKTVLYISLFACRRAQIWTSSSAS